MFTGLIQDIGAVQARAKARLVLATTLQGLKIGDSVACAGVCLTLVEVRAGAFVVEVSPETLDKTLIGTWEVGTRVNLEPALHVGETLGGHFVSGHVDGVAEVIDIVGEDEFYRLSVRPPLDLMPLIAPKGCVALDGISLTINAVLDDRFEVMIIPHTWEHTTLSRGLGPIHIEADLLARYAARILGFGQRI